MRRDGKAVRIDKSGRGVVVSPVRLGAGRHDEAWLQRIVQNCPLVLPVSDIEPGFGRLIPIAIEVPCAQGIIDNVFLTPEGDIAICELKLWRNPQARREVVAQCLDYVAALNAMSYEEFERACLAGQTDKELSSLYGAVCDEAGALEESEFIDAVSKNLDRGRILVMAVGDGIRSQAETLVNLLSKNVSSQFSFALVELSIYQDGDGAYFIVPSTLAKTAMILRHVVSSQSGVTLIEAMAESAISNDGTVLGSITETRFFEEMAARSPNLPGEIRWLLSRLEPLGVYPEWKASLNLYRDDPNGDRPFNLGYIQKNGQFYTSTAGSFGREGIAKAYHEGVAELVGGTLYQLVGDWHDTYATTNGKSAPRIEQLLPDHREDLLRLMTEYLSRGLSRSDIE